MCFLNSDANIGSIKDFREQENNNIRIWLAILPTLVIAYSLTYDKALDYEMLNANVVFFHFLKIHNFTRNHSQIALSNNFFKKVKKNISNV